jgi:hypothetical protein
MLRQHREAQGRIAYTSSTRSLRLKKKREAQGLKLKKKREAQGLKLKKKREAQGLKAASHTLGTLEA